MGWSRGSTGDEEHGDDWGPEPDDYYVDPRNAAEQDIDERDDPIEQWNAQILQNDWR